MSPNTGERVSSGAFIDILPHKTDCRYHLGAIVPLPRGLMRNYWYPRGKAEYVTRSQLKELGLRDSTIERDVMFMATKLPNKSQKDNSGNFGLKLTSLAVGFRMPPSCVLHSSKMF
jgi:hypothetical protein